MIIMKKLICLFCFSILIAGSAGAQGLKPINIALPAPMFVGTPTNFKIGNLEKPLGHVRPPFLAPSGTINIAPGKIIESSDNEPIIGDLSLLNDGDKEASEGSFLEMGPGKQNITFDLKGKFTIYAITVWHYHQSARVYKDVLVQVSNDPDFIDGVETVFNNDRDNSLGLGVGKDLHYVETNEGKLIDTRGVVGRYVRLYSNGNTFNELNHYIEVEIYGKPLN
jgi:hypothetical protein